MVTTTPEIELEGVTFVRRPCRLCGDPVWVHDFDEDLCCRPCRAGEGVPIRVVGYHDRGRGGSFNDNYCPRSEASYHGSTFGEQDWEG